MNWIENITRWRALSEGRKLQLRWNAIPFDVLDTMAFEGEPVCESLIREVLAGIESPALLRATQLASTPARPGDAPAPI